MYNVLFPFGSCFSHTDIHISYMYNVLVSLRMQLRPYRVSGKMERKRRKRIEYLVLYVHIATCIACLPCSIYMSMRTPYVVPVYEEAKKKMRRRRKKI